MEKEDQIIKELIKEGFLTSAPDDFTEKVMMAVANTQEVKKPLFDFSVLSYTSVIIATITLSLGIVYYISPSFIASTFGFIPGFFNKLYFTFIQLFKGSVHLNTGFEINGVIVGVVLIIITLLTFDGLLGRRKYLHFFA